MLSSRVRFFLYLFFLALFFLSAPLIVLYTAGYRFHFDTHQFVKTGVLSLSSFPKHANLFLDQKPQGDTPVFLNTVFPGTHHISLQKEGYLSWEKTLLVKGNETTAAEDVILFTDDVLKQTQSTAHNLLSSPNKKNLIVIMQQGSWLELWKTTLSLKLDALLIRLPALQESLSFSWSSQGSFLLIEDKKLETRTIIDIKKNTQITLPETASLQEVYWDPDLDDIVYLKSANRLELFSVNQRRINNTLEESVTGILRGSDWLFLRDSREQTGLYQQNGPSGFETLLAYVPQGTYRFYPAPPFFVSLKNEITDRLFFIDATASDLPLLLSVKTKNFLWNPQHPEELLYTNGFELHVYHADHHSDELITRLSHMVKKALWYPKGEVLLYEELNGIYAMERDGRNKRNVFALAQLDSMEEWWIDEEGKTLWMIGIQKGERGIFQRRLQK